MSGYNYNKWGRRGRGCGSQGSGDNQNSGYWNSRYHKYENYKQYRYPQLFFPQLWNPVCWNKSDHYGGKYGREQVSHNKYAPQQPFSPSQGHSKGTGHLSSVKVKTSQSLSRNRKRGSSSSLSRNQSSLHSKVTSPPLGSEEDRKKTLAQATDKIKNCLLSFQNEKSEVLENLLSNTEQEVVELSKVNPVRLEKSDYSELRLTPSDLKVIGMVATSGTGPSSEVDETGNYTVETISKNEFMGSSNAAEIVTPNSRDVFCTFNTHNTELLDDVDRVNMCSRLERETRLKDSSKSVGPEPHCRYTPESKYHQQLVVGEDWVSHSDPCAHSTSASLGISDAVDDSNQSRDCTNKKISYEHLLLNNRTETKETLKNLKQRIIQQFLKMGKSNLKDLIDNPRSRKFEFAMNHLMKKHRLLLSRELRGLAQSRIKGQDVENQGNSAPIQETNSLLDTDVEINLSHLPQEVIEQLGSLLQLDLLDNAESVDFQPITVDSEDSIHDLQNIQALQVALLSGENIKREFMESEIKPLFTREASGKAVDESGGGKNLVEGQGQTEDLLRRGMECEGELTLEESASCKKPTKDCNKWPNYIPLGKGFMNRSGEFGNMFPEFPHFVDMGSTEFEAVDGKKKNMRAIPCTRNTDGESDEHHKLETDQNPARMLDKLMNPDVVSEASEAHIRPTNEMTGCSSLQEVYVMPHEVLNVEIDVTSNKSLSNTSTEKSGIRRFMTVSLSSCDVVDSCSEEKWIDASQREEFDSVHNATDDISDNIPASEVATGCQTKDMLEVSRDAVEQLEDSPVTEGTGYSYEPLAENEEPLQSAIDKPLETYSKPANEIHNLNALVSGITEGMTVGTYDTGLSESEIKASDFQLSKEKHVTSIIDRESVLSGRQNTDTFFVGKHTENLQTNLNSSDSHKNLNLEINRNEENNCSVEDESSNKKTDRNQNESVGNEVSAVSDLSSTVMDVSFILSGNNEENTNCEEEFVSDKESIHSATAEHNVHSNDTAEMVKSGFSNEAEIDPCRGIQGSVVDGLACDICDKAIAEDNFTVGETQVSDSADNNISVTHISVSEEAEKVDGNDLSVLKSHMPDDSGYTENHTLAAEVCEQFELSSSYVANNHRTSDDIIDMCECNVVVKTEKADDIAKDDTSQHEVNNDASTVFSEPQNVDNLCQTQSSVIFNRAKEVATVEVGTQAQLSEELDSYDVEKILQLLEKSHQLSPQLAQSLKDHFSSSKVTERCEFSELSNSTVSASAKEFGAASVSKEKSPPYLISQPLNSKVLQSPHVHVSKIHNMNSPIEIRPLRHTSKLLYPMDGLGPTFQGPFLHGNEEKNSRKQKKLAKRDDTSLELNRMQKVGGGSKDSEGSACDSDLGIANTSELSAGIARSACIDGDMNGDLNAGKDIQESSVSSNSKYIFLKMLEIDKEIQKLMEMKLKLYTTLHLSLTTDASCPIIDDRHTPKLAGLQHLSRKTASSHALCNRMTVVNNSNTQQMHMGFVPIDTNKSTGSSCASDVATSASTPMVTLPIDYVKGSTADVQNNHLSLPKYKLNESMNTADTCVMEDVGNNYNLCSCQISDEVSTMVLHSDHSDQNETLGGGNEALSLKSGLDQVDSDGANKVSRYLVSHHSDYHRESDQSERNASLPKTVSLKKQILKPKRTISRGSYSRNKNNQPHEQHKTGIAMRNESSRPVHNQEKDGIVSSCEATRKKPVCSDSLIRTTVKELRNRNTYTMQRVGNIKCEQEFSQSDNNILVDDRKETVSPVRTKVLTTSNKNSENDSSASCNTSTRHSPRNKSVNKSIEELSFQVSNDVMRCRGDTKTRSHMDMEIQLVGVADTVCGMKKIPSPKGKSVISFGESDQPDCVSRVTRKRKLALKTDCSAGECVAGFQEEPTESRSRRSFSRQISDLQEIQTGVMDENATAMSIRLKRRVQTEQTDAVGGSMLPARQVKKRAISNSGYLQIRNNPKVQSSSPEILTCGLSPRTRQHVGVQKRKSHEIEAPHSKVQHLEPKVNPLQWNLQNCFVRITPLAIEKIGNSNKPKEELATTDRPNRQRLRSSSGSSLELSVSDFMERERKRTESKSCDVIHKSDDPNKVVFTELVETKLNEVEGCSSQQDPVGGIPGAQEKVAEVNFEPNESITSSPVCLPPDFTVQSHSPGHLVGQCILPEVTIQDENSISTLVSDTSDGEQYNVKRNGDFEKNEADMLCHSTDSKDACDRDSVCSYDTGQEGREETNSKAPKHKSAKKHKKDRKSDGIERLVFESHEGPVLDIKTVGRHVLAASEDGSVYCYSLKSGKYKRKFGGHNGAVTCLCVIECGNSIVNSDLEVSDAEHVSPDTFFTGSLDWHLRIFRFKTGEMVRNAVDVGSPIQCMDHYGGIIYIGTQAGDVARYNIKMSSLIGEPIKIGRESILTLKATKEGPRQVLIIGSRNKPIAVRDAATGLLLRTVCNNWNHTVYSLVLSTNFVYCGTKTGSIPAFLFTSGDEVCRFQAAAGVVCLRVYNDLLFAGCYDGNIYVFSIHDKTQVACIAGPGRMLLCMDIVKNRIIAGSKDCNKLEAWGFPQEIRNHLKEAKQR